MSVSPDRTPRPEYRVDSVERALSLLEAFDAERASLSLAELAEETGLYKSTILRLAASLIRYGYLRKDADGRYRPGPALWRLGALYRRGHELDDVIRPTLRKLVRDTGETASFYVIDADERLCLYRENAPGRGRHHLDEGMRMSLQSGAAGHVLSAWALGCTIAKARLRPDGGCLSIGERSPGYWAGAVPVIVSGAHCLGALAVSGPQNRLHPQTADTALAALGQAAAMMVTRMQTSARTA
ncbi:MAG: IclR family transcriptional regulator [Rhodobacteraceae bacterium]|nr:IclR family transcriptional regulator [Paracoccaceae bacterium]